MLTGLTAVAWLPPSAVVPVSVRAANVTPDRVGMKAGQRWPFGIVLHTLLISSANDAAYALAERISGSVERFAGPMQLAAREIGMVDHPVLHDPAGLDGTDGIDGGNLVSAWDLATAARDVMASPTLAAIVGLTQYRFTGPDGIVYELASHNRAFLESYPGAVGVKTGYTYPAGVCVAEAARRGGRLMLAVVMNGISPDRTAELLLDRGFATPARAESRDPALPSVRQPGLVPPSPPPTAPARHGAARADASTRQASQASRAGPPATDQTPIMVASGAALGLVAVATLMLIGWARRRRPAG
jgi:D-alanyl-D-alanine carboxypeptidase